MKSKANLIAGVAAVAAIGVMAFMLWAKGSGSAHALTKTAITSVISQSTAQNQGHQLPPSGEPLMSTYADLLSRAKSSDPVASKRLFDDIRECMQAKRLDEVYQRLSKDKDWIVNNPGAFREGDPSGAQERGRALSGIEAGMERIQQAAQLCTGAPNDLDDGRIYDIALSAARSGDAQAIACLLLAPYKSPSELTQEQGDAYGNEVMALGEAGIQRGDWNVALAMTVVYSGMGLGGYSNFVRRIDPEKELAYSALVRLGTPDGSPDAANLDRRLSILSDTLPPQSQIEAKDWAEQAYKRYYFYSGPVFPDSQACDF